MNKKITVYQAPEETSEDIQALDENRRPYLNKHNEIRMVIKGNEENDEVDSEIINDCLDAISNIVEKPSLLNIFARIRIFIVNKRKRKKMRKVIENLLGKIFDVSNGWYTMDYRDLKETCDSICGKKFFDSDDHNHIYIVVLQKLKYGPIRDKCIEIGEVKFLNAKEMDIRSEYLKFKIELL